MSDILLGLNHELRLTKLRHHRGESFVTSDAQFGKLHKYKYSLHIFKPLKGKLLFVQSQFSTVIN